MSIRIHDNPLPDFSPDRYILDPALRQAVEIAIALEQPLLLTGEPGTGKTRLAYKIAHDLAAEKNELNFSAEPLVFHTKTTAAARDLFYTYDALGHFQAANIKRDGGSAAPTTADFIELQALGKAIALTNVDAIDKGKFRTELPAQPQSSVVLIDEVDKAPRDLPNDILNEIEQYEFQIFEQDGYCVRRAPGQRIVTVMTSNSEKNLPDAFLRRCVFYHIPFPDANQLFAIAKAHLGDSTSYTDQALRELIDHFEKVRRQAVRKPPATAELLAWLRILGMHELGTATPQARQGRLKDYLSILVKTKEDMEAVRSLYAN
jgi:MoxR-like ATPase